VTPNRAAVEAAIEELRGGFQADGADLEVMDVTDVTARVRLIVTSDTCLECIVPGPILHGVIESSVRQAMPSLERLDLDDPRTQS